jgi:hypothetical protein
MSDSAFLPCLLGVSPPIIVLSLFDFPIIVGKENEHDRFSARRMAFLHKPRGEIARVHDCLHQLLCSKQ